MQAKKLPASQLKVGDEIYFSHFHAIIDRLVPVAPSTHFPTPATKVYGHFKYNEGIIAGTQHLATSTDKVLFTVYNR